MYYSETEKSKKMFNSLKIISTTIIRNKLIFFKRISYELVEVFKNYFYDKFNYTIRK